MSIVISDKSVGLWFVGREGMDFLAGITEVEADQKYLLQWRFRHHNDDKSFDSTDEKHWYEGQVSGTKNKALETIRTMTKLTALALNAAPVYEELMNEKGPSDLMERWSDQPFTDMRVEIPEGGLVH
jgi:hypothetical protein